MEQNKKECKQCKKGLNKTQNGMLIIGGFIFATSIYGTIELIKLIFTLF